MSKVYSDLKQADSSHFQEELARTYFSNPPSKNNDTARLKAESGRRNNWLAVNVVTTAIVLITAVFFFLSNRIVIDIKVIPHAGVGLSAHSATLDKKETGVIYLNRNGELNSDIIQNIVFYENANKSSAWDKGLIALSNESPSGRAILGVDFSVPMNFAENSMHFFLKSGNGNEEMRIVLKDNSGRFCHSKVNGLRNYWQRFIIDAQGAEEFVDLKNVTHIDFEVNPDEKQNPNRSLVYLRDLYLAKKGGVRE